MKNIYQKHLEHLRKMKTSDQPAISIFIPLRWTDVAPEKIFSSLLKAADHLLKQDGYQKVNLQMPEWDRWPKQGTVTLGIFHHNGLSHLIPLPTKMQPRVVVAKTFHIKPIVAASHEYVDALLLHFNESGASLFRVHPASEVIIDHYLPSEVVPKPDWPLHLRRDNLREYLEFLLMEIRGAIKPSTKFIGITGTGHPELRSELFWKKARIPVVYLDESFKISVPQNSLSIIKLRLSQIINEIHSDNVLKALKEKKSKNDQRIIKLAPKIIKGEIKNLCVSLDCMHFGILKSETGEMTIHKIQKNSSDDDLLDDLVELAIDRGIDVSVVPKKYLPEGCSFVAS
jgi:hypothetical protein